jgi:outer membrane protein assembly factor BamB
MVADDKLISVIEGRQYVWHVKYVEEDTSQRLPIVAKDHFYLLNQRTKGGMSLAAVTPKQGTPPTSTTLWSAWKGEPMNVMIEVGGVLLSGGADKVYATRASDGSELWSAKVPSEVVDLACTDGRLFVVCRSGEVLCFEGTR